MGLLRNQLLVLGVAIWSAGFSAWGDTFVVTSTSDAGPGSLRQTIEDANLSPGLDEVRFQLPGPVLRIVLDQPLPAIAEPLVIDGSSQPGHAEDPRVEISGEKLSDPDVDHGFVISAGASTIRGLMITRFPGAGIVLLENGGNVIEGNYIGTDASGRLEKGNGSGGVYVLTSGNRVGGNTPAQRNVLAGNGHPGIILNEAGASGNQVLNNLIGLNPQETAVLPNALSGILINEAPENLIGGASPKSGNIIAGNDGAGILINGAAARRNRIIGNLIGTPSDGQSVGFGNGLGGVSLLDAVETQIGGGAPGERNVISGNAAHGVEISGAGSQGNRVSGNYIGLSADGNSPIANTGSGVILLDCSSNWVGGLVPAERNWIAGNAQDGIHVEGADAAGNRISGNWVGLSAAGEYALPNLFSGIVIAAPHSQVGGATVGERNVVSGNQLAGIHLFGALAEGSVVAGNYVGTDPSGRMALPNQRMGILVDKADNCVVGEKLRGAGNLVSGNHDEGVLVRGCTGTLVFGNRIGLASDGVASLPNQSSGVRIQAGESNQIGGLGFFEGNQIAFNLRNGVSIEASRGPLPGSGLGNTVVGNRIYANGFLTIDLNADGATSNDGFDVDEGPNSLINRPELRELETVAHRLVVRGRFNGAPDTEIWLDLYESPGCVSGGIGQASTHLDRLKVRTNPQGQAEFMVALSGWVAVAGGISATATDLSGNTSEFSDCLLIPDILALAPSFFRIGPGSDQIELRWLDPSNTAVLEQRISLDGAPIWRPVAETPSSEGRFHVLRLGIGPAMSFFRLSRP